MMTFVVSPHVVAKEISYDYIQGTYVSTTIDGGELLASIEGRGFAMSGSISISQNVAFIAGFRATEFDRFFGIEFDTTELTLGLSSHKSIAPKTDVFFTLAMFVADVEISNEFDTYSEDDTGNVIRLGFRHLVTNEIELNMSLSRVDVFDDKSNSFELGVVFLSNDDLSFGVGYETGDDVDTLLLNIRIDI